MKFLWKVKASWGFFCQAHRIGMFINHVTRTLRQDRNFFMQCALQRFLNQLVLWTRTVTFAVISLTYVLTPFKCETAMLNLFFLNEWIEDVLNEVDKIERLIFKINLKCTTNDALSWPSTVKEGPYKELTIV